MPFKVKIMQSYWLIQPYCVSAKATYAAISSTYAYLTPDLWKETVFSKAPYQEFTDYLAKNHKPIGSQRQEVKQY